LTPEVREKPTYGSSRKRGSNLRATVEKAPIGDEKRQQLTAETVEPATACRDESRSRSGASRNRDLIYIPYRDADHIRLIPAFKSLAWKLLPLSN
jgi:hypothetical protein